MLPQSRRAVLLVACALAGATLLALPARNAAAASSLDAGRLEFGVISQPTELSWMTGSGVPWRYRYQYLAGGVNTGSGWETWQDPAKPPGQYVVDYINRSCPSATSATSP